ncbi:hypothetical protein [Helicobacter pylori]|uniref:hypothetical protein n=1 Tax=Helicobacter pylori TaxID=210 RepID=UPI001E415F36|nr:hypothetical protein [Helicobacter pylori]
MRTTTIIMAANTTIITRNNTPNNKQSNMRNNSNNSKHTNNNNKKHNNKTNNIDWGVYGAALGLLFGFLTFSFNLVFFTKSKILMALDLIFTTKRCLL